MIPPELEREPGSGSSEIDRQSSVLWCSSITDHFLHDYLFTMTTTFFENSSYRGNINWVQYLGPPGPFSFPDSRHLLEVLVDLLTVFSRIDFPPLLRKGGKWILDDDDRFPVGAQLQR